MNIEIIAPDRNIFKGKAELIQVPGTNGRFTILKNHAAIVSTLEKGKVRIIDKETKEERFFEINKGMLEAKNNSIVILAE